MLNTKPNAFNKIGILVRTSLQKIENLNKPRIKFMYSLFELWLIFAVAGVLCVSFAALHHLQQHTLG